MTTSSSFHRFITNQLNDLLPVGLLAQLVGGCTGIAQVKGSNPIQASIFSGFLFATAKVASATAMFIFHLIILFFTPQFSYMIFYIFITDMNIIRFITTF